MTGPNGKSIIKPLLSTVFFLIVSMACLLTVFLSITVGAAYSLTSWLTSTPKVADLIYRTATLDATTLAQLVTAEAPTSPPATVETLDTLPAQETEALLPTATITPKEVILVPTETPTLTPVPVTPTPDAVLVKQTEEAQKAANEADMQNLIQNLVANQVIKKKEGSYFRLNDFEGEWNDTGSLQFTDTDMALSDFVLRADVNWQVDGNQGDWAESGCGIVFRADEMGNYYMIYLSLDGRGRLVRKLNGSTVMLGRSTIYNVDRDNGQASFMLVVEGERVRYFVNDKVKFDKYVQPQIGKLQWTIVSGNKRGFGTYCKISNIDIWKMGN